MSAPLALEEDLALARGLSSGLLAVLYLSVLVAMGRAVVIARGTFLVCH